MTLRLQKGQRLDLTRGHPRREKLNLQVEWSVSADGRHKDLDISAFLLEESGKASGAADFVYYNAPRLAGQGVVYVTGGKTRRGMGEHLRAIPKRIPQNIVRIAVTLSLHYEGSGVPSWPREVFFAIVDEADAKVIAEFSPQPPQGGRDALILGELYRHKEDWKFQVVDQFFTGGLAGLCGRFGLEAEAPAPPRPAPRAAVPPQPARKPSPPVSPAPVKPTGPKDLQKGEKAPLAPPGKEIGSLIAEIFWDKKKDGAGRDMKPQTAAFLLHADHQVHISDDFIHFGNPGNDNASVFYVLEETCRSGFRLQPSRFPDHISEVVITIALQKGYERRQDFARLSGLCLRISDEETGEERFRYRPGPDFRDKTAMIIGKLYRYKDTWKFQATGQGFTGELPALCRKFGLKAKPAEARAEMGFRRLNREQDGPKFVARKEVEISEDLIRQHFHLDIEDSGWGVFERRVGSGRLDIYVMEPGLSRPYYCLATHGISNLPASAALPTELMLCLPSGWPMSAAALKSSRNSWPIDLLEQLAGRMAETRQVWEPGQVVANDGVLPYSPHCSFCGVLLYLPTLMSEYEELVVNTRKSIRFLSPIPLYKDEIELARDKGSDALCRELAESGITELLQNNRENLGKRERKKTWFGFGKSRE